MLRLRLLSCALLVLGPSLEAQSKQHGKPSSASGAIINGHSYLNLQRWAASQHFTARLNRPRGEAILTNRWSRFEFKADSKRAEFNHVCLWLSWPVIARTDGFWIAKLDAEKLLEPLIHPPRLGAGGRIRTIAIGAGHGGKDPGNQEGRRQEKDFTLKLALELEQRLKRAGFQVVLIRRRDVFVELLDRPALAKKQGADLYLSLHYNAAGRSGTTARGVEVYCLTPGGAESTNDSSNHGWPSLPANRFDLENVALAWHLQREIAKLRPLEDRGVRRARFLELTQMKMPAVLIEGGFMTNPQDAATIYSELGRGRLAGAIVDGVQTYKRAVERYDPLSRTIPSHSAPSPLQHAG